MEKVKILIIAIITSLPATSCAPTPVKEALGSCSNQQSMVVENHITNQINAIANGDWQVAYDYAAVSFQKSVSLDQFKRVIKRQYLFLIFNEGFTFGECKNTDRGINQIVLVDFQGKKRTLSYDLTLINDRLGVVAATEIAYNNTEST